MKRLIFSIIFIALVAESSDAREPVRLMFSGNVENMSMGDPAVTAPPLSRKQFSIEASYFRFSSETGAGNEFSAETFIAAGRRAAINLLFRGADDMTAGGGVSFFIGDALYADATFKYIRQKESGGSVGKAFCADLGLCWSEGPFTAGIKASNIGSNLKSEEGGSLSLPSSIKAGLSYSFNASLSHRFVLVADAGWYLPERLRTFTASGGIEYSFNGRLFVRGGYRFCSSPATVPSFASAGLGYRIHGFGVKAAYIFATGTGPIKNAFLCGLSFDI